MVSTTRYRVFASGRRSLNACNYRFVVGPDDMENMPTVQFDCPRCEEKHAFNLEQDFIANTPKQRKTMRQWADRLGIEVKTDL